MTVIDIKNLFGVKPKISIPDDYIVTNEDIIMGNVFQKYSTNGTLAGTINGLSIIDDEINYVYALINNLDVETDDFFPACGGEQPITVYANYSIYAKNVNGDDKVIESDKRNAVNAIITLNNELFSYSKPNLVNPLPNNSKINNEVDVLATYYHRGKKYEATKHVIQHINSYSSWLVESEPTNYITLTLSDTNVSNKGGVITVKVERCYSRIYYMIDSCGNKVGGKSEPGLIEDITNKSLITSSNRKEFTVNRNAIIVKEQEIGAEERSATITAKFLDFTDSVVLHQNEGDKVTYEYELYFDDGKKIKYLPLDSSLPTATEIYLQAKEKQYIDGEFYKEVPTKEITVRSNDSWVKGYVSEDENGVKAIISTTEANTDRENDREASLILYCTNDKKTDIELIISQPAMEVVKEIYHCEYVGKQEINSSEIDNNGVCFNIYKTLVYEDGEQETVEIENDAVVKYSFNCDNGDLLSMTGLSKNNDYMYCAKFINKTKRSVSEIASKIVVSIYSSKQEKLYESDVIKFVVKGTDVYSSLYELSFENGENYLTAYWHETDEPHFIKIVSIKNILKNGLIINKENAAYKICLFDKLGNELRNTDFSIKVLNDGIFVFPMKTDKTINDTFTIVQKDTGKQINALLSYIKKEAEIIDTPITVIFKSNSVKEEIWTGESSYLLIDNKISIKLSPCWISPSMSNKTDIAYNGKVKLKEGTHMFEIYNGKCLSIGKSSEISYKKAFKIDKNTKSISIEIEI